MRKIAIIRRNGFGDLLCALPLVHYLREKHPEDQITLFLEKRNAPLIPYLPPICETYVLPNQGNKYLRHLLTGLKFRSQKFDIAICAKTSPMKLMNFFLYSLGAKERMAYVDSKKWSSTLINKPRIYDAEKAKDEHQALKTLQLISPDIREIPQKWYPQLRIPVHLEQEKQEEVTSLKGPILLLSATTTKPASRLSGERYASFVNELQSVIPDLSVLIVGQIEDQQRANEIATALRLPYEVHFPRHFADFMLLLNRANLFFVGDGGVAHIGAALGKAGVVLFGETSPVQWQPLSAKFTCLHHPQQVESLTDEEIWITLKRAAEEVFCGRSYS